MKITLFRNGTWFSGLCLDQVKIKTDGTKTIDDLGQQRYYLEKMGYELQDDCNNPFSKTEQFEYYNESKDKVVVRFSYRDKTVLNVLKQYNDIENCETTAEVITRLGGLNKLHEDIVKLFRDAYGIEESEAHE